MTEQEMYVKNNNLSLYSVVRDFVNDCKFINLAKIVETYNDNYIKVKLYTTEEVIDNVRIMHIGTAKYRVRIQLMIGDNVLVVATQHCVEDTNVEIDSDDVPPLAPSYSTATMNAILISPEHDIDVLTDISVDEDGNAKIATQGKVEVSVIEPPQDKKDNEEAEAEVLEQILIDQESITINDEKNKTKIVLDKDGIKGLNENDLMLELGNSVSTLGKLVSDLLDKLIQLKTIGSPYQHTLDPGTISNLQTIKQQWEKVFK